jgi:hypothetical protein
MPFLTIYTPTYKRPKLLAQCKATVAMQTCQDIQHYVRFDNVGVGIDGMYRQLKQDVGDIRGDYVYILPDDDRLCDVRAVETLQRFVQANDSPPVVIVRTRKASYMLPLLWQQEPRQGHIDLASYVVRRDVFQAHVKDFGERYEGDFDFIHAVWRAGWAFSWLDFMFSETDHFMMGRPE